MNPFMMPPRGRKPHRDLSKRQSRRIKSQHLQSVLSACEPVSTNYLEEKGPSQGAAAPIQLSETTLSCNPIIIGEMSPQRFPNSSATRLQTISKYVEVLESVDIMENASSGNESETDRDLSSTESMISSNEESSISIEQEILSPHKVASTFQEKLASYVVENGLSHQAGDNLLTLLRSHTCFASLPTVTRTLLDTPRQPPKLLDVHPGQYLHLGFELAIISILESVPLNCLPSAFKIDFSTDGATLGKDTSQIWPLQCRVANIRNSPVAVIGVYRGQGKPTSAMDFLRPFIVEANRIILNGGVLYSGERRSIIFCAFIADAPARALVLNHMGHNASRPCSKCKVTGEYINRRMTLPGVDHLPRTDDEYLHGDDEDHHKVGEAPLSLLPISMVSQVPFEYMHLVCIGCMKRLLLAWVDGKFSFASKLSAHKINLISERLNHLSDYCPKEFARRPRGLNFYHNYKATEFRQLLLYTGPVVLKNILSDEYYTHDLVLHAAKRILVSACSTKEQLHYARLSLKMFVGSCGNLYGAEFVTYNIHGLLHLVDDVELLGPFDSFSTFPYENNMTIFRKYCKKPHLQLAQIARRRAE